MLDYLAKFYSSKLSCIPINSSYYAYGNSHLKRMLISFFNYLGESPVWIVLNVLIILYYFLRSLFSLHSQPLLDGFLLALIVKAKIIVLSFRFGHFPVAHIKNYMNNLKILGLLEAPDCVWEYIDDKRKEIKSKEDTICLI